MASPLDQFISATPNRFPVRISPIPSVPLTISKQSPAGIAEALAVHQQATQEAMEKWRQDLERTLNTVAANASAQVTTTTTTAPATTQAAAPTTPLPTDLVTLTDEQALEKKTIGLNQPRAARFTHAITSNVIAAGESVYVPANCNLVIAGFMTITGILTVDGYFTSVV